MQKELIEHLQQIANCYYNIGDLQRYLAFTRAASSLNSGKTQGIGSSIEEVISQFNKTKQSTRLDELIGRGALLCPDDFFNFDIEYLAYLNKTYSCKTKEDLIKITELRTQQALSFTEESLITLTSATLNKFLGDGFVQTSYSGSSLSLEEIVKHLAQTKKHIFISDNIPSPNLRGSLTESTFKLQKSKIQALQVDHNIRIFQGCVVDVDMEGNPRASDTYLNQAEYIIVTCSTTPHENQSLRLQRAFQALQRFKKRVFIKILDRFDDYVPLVFDLIQHNINSFVVAPKNDYELNKAKALFDLVGEYKEILATARFLIGSSAKDLTEFSRLDVLGDLTSLLEDKIINNDANPLLDFRTSNKAGIRNEKSTLVAHSRYDNDRFSKISQALEELNKKMEDK